MSAIAERAQSRILFLSGLLGVAVVGEFALLRTGTRTLIHIPGLGRMETPVRVMAEVGRFLYYFAVVLLVVLLVDLAFRVLRKGGSGAAISGVCVILFLTLALAGRAGVIPALLVGWAALAVLAILTLVSWRGIRWIPVGLFVLASIAAGVSVLGQGEGGGLSGAVVDWLVMVAEVLLFLAALSSPLVVGARPTVPVLVAGAVVAVLSAGAFAVGGPTLTILILWNVGVPGWLPGIAYGLAFGGLTVALWLALSTQRWLTAVGIVLLAAGGVGVISTYQTGLVIAAVLLLAVAGDRVSPQTSQSGGVGAGDAVVAPGSDGRELVRLT